MCIFLNINAINTTLKASNVEGGNFGTTGISAVSIGGSTLHSKTKGFALPINVKGYRLLSKAVKDQLKELHRDKKYIIIDEFSMLKQIEILYLDKRLREIIGINAPFGGMAVLLVGDIAVSYTHLRAHETR